MANPANDIRTYWNVQTFCLLTLTLIALGAALYFLRPVLVPFVLAVFLTQCLLPLIEFQQRHLRIPRALAIASAAVAAIVVVAAFGSLVATSIAAAAPRLQDYEKRFQEFTEATARSASLQQSRIHVDADQVARFFAVQEGTGWQFISAALAEATNIVSGGVIVVIFMLFLLVGKPDAHRHTGMLGEIEASVRRYVLTLVLLSIGTGVLVGVTLTILGVELAWVFAFLTFLLNFVPNIGSIVAWLLPLPVILLSPDMSITAKILAMAIPAIIHLVGGNVVLPKVQGNALALHPVAVLLSLMFFGMIWGITGAFLAAPITGIIRIVCARIPVTEPIADVLAGNLSAFSTGPNRAVY
ncbi:MAG: AI-2E family transporter [Planctomycetaceae bacterium]|nr:AI-2E family transporter [Planctomycetaceae bacterium]